MTDTEMAIIQRGNTEELRALIFQKDAQCAEKDKTIEWQRKVLENGVPVSRFTGEAKDEIDAAREEFANLGDDVCKTVEALGGERIPPKPKEVDENSRRNLYELVKGIKAKRGVVHDDLEIFLQKSTWRFRGFSAREIYEDVEGLNKFYNAERMAISRQEQAMK